MSFKVIVLAVATLGLIQTSQGSPFIFLDIAKKASETGGNVAGGITRGITGAIGNGLTSIGLKGNGELWTGVGDSFGNLYENFGQVGGSIAGGFKGIGQNALKTGAGFIGKGKDIFLGSDLGFDKLPKGIAEEVTKVGNGFLVSVNDNFENQLKSFETVQKKFEEKADKLQKEALKKLESESGKISKKFDNQIHSAKSDAAKECLEEQKERAQEEFEEKSDSVTECLGEKQTEAGEFKNELQSKMQEVQEKFTKVNGNLRGCLEMLKSKGGPKEALECVNKIKDEQKDSFDYDLESVQEHIQNVKDLTNDLTECSKTPLDDFKNVYAEINKDARECLKLKD